MASGDPETIWGPATNSVMLSILVRNDSTVFSADDINDAAEMIARIKRHTNAVSTFLWQQASQKEQSTFMDFQSSGSNVMQAQASLADVLNKTIASPNIFTIERFLGIRLTGETRLLLEKDPIGTNLVALNRLLLEDCYPFELARRPHPDGTKVKRSEPVVLIVSLTNLSTNASSAESMGEFFRFGELS